MGKIAVSTGVVRLFWWSEGISKAPDGSCKILQQPQRLLNYLQLFSRQKMQLLRAELEIQLRRSSWLD